MFVPYVESQTELGCSQDSRYAKLTTSRFSFCTGHKEETNSEHGPLRENKYLQKVTM